MTVLSSRPEFIVLPALYGAEEESFGRRGSNPTTAAGRDLKDLFVAAELEESGPCSRRGASPRAEELEA